MTAPAPCTVCHGIVDVAAPLAPVVCPACALWRLRGRATAFYRSWGSGDVYFITPDDDEAMLTAPTLRLHLDDGTDIVTIRLRCLGLHPQPNTWQQLISITPSDNLMGVRR